MNTPMNIFKLTGTPPKVESQPQLQSEKSGFIKFPKIENLGEMDIAKLQALGTKFRMYVDEKLDGANIGLRINNDGTYKCFARNGGDANNLFTFQAEKEQLEPLISYIVENFNFIVNCNEEYKDVCAIYLWGEFFGPHINKRIRYDKTTFMFYDMGFVKSDGSCELMSPIEFLHYEHLLFLSKPKDVQGRQSSLPWAEVLPWGRFFSRQDWFDGVTADRFTELLPLPAKSGFSSEGSNREGYVLRIVEETEDGRLIYRGRFKYKDPVFLESKPRKKLSMVEVSPMLMELKKSFETYINENRAIGILSKTSDRDVSTLIRSLINDAKEDFYKDYEAELALYEKRELQLIFNTGKLPYMTIKKVLDREQNDETTN